MTRTDWDEFCEWFNISGNLYTDQRTGWSIWQTIEAYHMKKAEYKTKKKAQLEATAEENKSEVIDYLRSVKEEERSHNVTEWMKAQFLATAKAREILDEFEEGKENTGERE